MDFFHSPVLEMTGNLTYRNSGIRTAALLPKNKAQFT